MQLIFTLISSLALVATSVAAPTVAVPEPRAASFTTFECNNCGRDAPTTCTQHNHQNVPSETCFLLEPNQQSIRVDYTVRGPNCSVYLYASNNCTGSGPVFPGPINPGTGECKPIPANERTSYQVLCT